MAESSFSFLPPEPTARKDKYRAIYQPRGAAREYSEMAVNLFQGCIHNCTYCYAPGTLRRAPDEFHSTNATRKGIISMIQDDLQEMEAAGDKRPVLLCFTCDAYQGPDKSGMDNSPITRQALELFRAFDHPFQILTKGGRRALRDFDLYTEADEYAATLTLADEATSLKWEPGAALPDDRMAAIRAAKKQGIKTWVSFEPVIIPEHTFRLYEQTKECVDLFKIGKLNKFPNDTDWRRFGESIINMCERDGKPYYIKDALRAFL